MSFVIKIKVRFHIILHRRAPQVGRPFIVMSRFALSRSLLPRSRAFSRISLVALLAASAATGTARADEFSPVPAGDPIYRQLGVLAPAGTKTSAGMTRYEAALQVARVITRVSNDGRADLSRVGWRAMRDLTVSLQTELRQLGIDVETARALADRNLQTPVLGASESGLSLGTGSNVSAAPTRATVAGGALGVAVPQLGVQTSSFNASIRPRLRVGAALLALQRAESDPLRNSSAGQTLLAPGAGHVLGNNASLDYDVNSWLSVRAQTSRRSLSGPADASPFLRAAFFDGAGEAHGAGGGLGIGLGPLNFSTEVERLSTDAGARGTSVGGGIGLSAWQNRLSLSAHLARLQPEDRAVLPSTRAELNVGLEVSKRLNLSLFYQGLFSQRNEGSERIAGGLNLSF